MPVSPGSLGDENLSTLEKKIGGTKKSSTFPPSNDDLSSSDDFKESDNKDLMGSINSKALEKPFLTKTSVLSNTNQGSFKDLKNTSQDPKNTNQDPKNTNQDLKNTSKDYKNISQDLINSSNSTIESPGMITSTSKEISKKDSVIAESKQINRNESNENILKQNIAKENYTDIATTAETLLQTTSGNSSDIKGLLGSCQFFNDQCPKDYMLLGNFSVQGVDSSNYILSCGNVQNTTPAKAIAEIKNNSVYDIHITDKGRGFSPLKPPRVTITGGGGVNATAEAVIDDDGFLALIKVTSKGHSYIETPNILIDPPMNDSSCHLCCKI
jgi:hypothetical protein